MKFNKIIFCAFVSLSIQACTNPATTQTLDANAFEKALAETNSQLLDVRTLKEYNTGHLANALQANWNNEEEFEKRVKALDKEKKVLVYCLSGIRSNSAMQWLTKNGFKHVLHLKGGINAWKQANKSIVEGIIVNQISMQTIKDSIYKYKEVVVEFGATWCPPCKKMKPTLDSLKQFIPVIQINAAEQETLAKAFNITEMPTLFFYRNGKQFAKQEGIIYLQEMKKIIQ